MSKKLPIVAIPCNRIEYQRASAHAVKNSYVKPLLEIVKCVPIFIPAIGEDFDLKQLGGIVDGLLLTGSTSNVCPSNYGGTRDFEDQYLDTQRDATNLPIIRHAIEMDIPVIAICRGFQELNVVCGGSLHQHVHKLPGMLNHRCANPDAQPKEQYELHSHKVITKKGGLFEKLGLPGEFTTNSLHAQGIDRLGNGLHVEALAEDGLIEAISVPGKRFILGTQWHPEGDFWLSAASKTIFEGFARAVHQAN